MRLLLLMVFIIMSSYCIAQYPKVQKMPKVPGKQLNKAQMDSVLSHFNINLQNGNVVVSPKLKSGIHYLPDGMPCIVPQEPTAGKIPNAFNGIRLNRNTIPNPALPKSNKPGEKKQ